MNSSDRPLAGRVCIITGANTGIGKVTAMALAQQGAHMFLACRSESKTMPVVEEIASATGATVEFLHLDLADLASVRKAAADFLSRKLPLHLLVNNAGIAGGRGITTDGFELAFGINHLGHFLFTTLLLETLKSSAPARIVHVASRAHYMSRAIDFVQQRETTATYTGMTEYRRSKLANVLFNAELARRLTGTGVTTYALHPGVVASDIWHRVPGLFRGLVKLFMISVEEGAKTSIYCASSPEVADQSGLYYDSCKSKPPSKKSRDEALAARLWEESAAWVNPPQPAG